MEDKKGLATEGTTRETSPGAGFLDKSRRVAQGENHHHAGYHCGAGCAVHQREHRAGQVSYHCNNGRCVLFRNAK